MRTLLANRIKCVVALLVSSGAATVLHFAWGRDQDRWDYMTGWTLLALMLVLAAFSARKRLSFLSFFSAAAWLQFHLYAGCFAALLFVIHIQFRWPIGWFEVGLTGFYAVVTVSGIVGIFLSRVFAKRMGAALASVNSPPWLADDPRAASGGSVLVASGHALMPRPMAPKLGEGTVVQSVYTHTVGPIGSSNHIRTVCHHAALLQGNFGQTSHAHAS